MQCVLTFQVMYCSGLTAFMGLGFALMVSQRLLAKQIACSLGFDTCSCFDRNRVDGQNVLQLEWIKPYWNKPAGVKGGFVHQYRTLFGCVRQNWARTLCKSCTCRFLHCNGPLRSQLKAHYERKEVRKWPMPQAPWQIKGKSGPKTPKPCCGDTRDEFDANKGTRPVVAFSASKSCSRQHSARAACGQENFRPICPRRATGAERFNASQPG